MVVRVVVGSGGGCLGAKRKCQRQPFSESGLEGCSEGGEEEEEGWGRHGQKEKQTEETTRGEKTRA